jgi:hypothetical protein
MAYAGQAETEDVPQIAALFLKKKEGREALLVNMRPSSFRTAFARRQTRPPSTPGGSFRLDVQAGLSLAGVL